VDGIWGCEVVGERQYCKKGEDRRQIRCIRNGLSFEKPSCCGMALLRVIPSRNPGAVSEPIDRVIWQNIVSFQL
jgi:hypothetical protein